MRGSTRSRTDPTTRPTANGVVRTMQDDGLVQLSRGRLKVLEPDLI